MLGNLRFPTYQARKIADISIRRVNQVWKQYQLIGEIPKIGKNNGRPKKPIEDGKYKWLSKHMKSIEYLHLH